MRGGAASRGRWGGCLGQMLLAVNFRQPSHEFTFGGGINFMSDPLVLTPLI
jgi:hypothetical protein